MPTYDNNSASLTSPPTDPVHPISGLWQQPTPKVSDDEPCHWLRRTSSAMNAQAEMYDSTVSVISIACTSCNQSTWNMSEGTASSGSCVHATTSIASTKLNTNLNTIHSTSLHRTYQESEASSASGGDDFPEPVTPATASSEESASPSTTGIRDIDFASHAPVPRLSTKREGIQSVRQSLAPGQIRRPRWFECEDKVSFQFKLTPRSGRRSASSVPKANADGSSSSSSSASQHPPAPPRNASFGISELGADDPSAWQRLLTSALFLIKEDNMPSKSGQAKVIDLDLLDSRRSGGKHLAMRHRRVQEHEASSAVKGEEAKRIRWRVVVRPVGRAERGGLLPR